MSDRRLAYTRRERCLAAVHLIGALVLDWTVGWLTFADASPSERRQQRIHLVAFGLVVGFAVVVVTERPAAAIPVVGGVAGLLAVLELVRIAGLALPTRRNGSFRRRRR